MGQKAIGLASLVILCDSSDLYVMTLMDRTYPHKMLGLIHLRKENAKAFGLTLLSDPRDIRNLARLPA